MNKELLDNEFYEKKEIPSRDWWESRRNIFNKFLLLSIVCLFLITFLFFLNSRDGFTGALIVCIILSLMFFSFTHLVYSGVWVAEDAIKKIFNLKINHHSRINLFRFIIFLAFSPVVLFLIIIMII